ncbi:MAG: MarR family transcriptional regulator [Microbacteriaceae bacterium]|jgi:DNA-binding MarR family transcriptional regulator|nr:MAG: MarR family transcriptional regulator [Microbacteriaceae bacterium BACL25 MAG-120322-bin65]HAA79771.1 MarR family transcriptional regulator [Microbacteriaceae bacterium]|tara:strand:+ start:2826 stop:3335 length:510 start_codon:yes stop_codon:yes gene_type:complete
MSSPGDDVDHIVSAWRRERPDLDVSPLEVLSRVTRIAKRVDRFRREAFKSSGLESWEFDVLAALRRAGKPYQQSPGALMAQALISSGAMTHRLTKLETRGLVTRSSDPDDGRGVVVRITTAGLKAVDTAFATLVEAEQDLLSAVTKEEQAIMASALRVLSLDVESREPR